MHRPTAKIRTRALRAGAAPLGGDGKGRRGGCPGRFAWADLL